MNSYKKCSQQLRYLPGLETLACPTYTNKVLWKQPLSVYSEMPISSHYRIGKAESTTVQLRTTALNNTAVTVKR